MSIRCLEASYAPYTRCPTCYGTMMRMSAQSAPDFDIRSSLWCLLDSPAFGFHVRLGLFATSREHVPDEEVVDDGSHHAADQRSHYRNPEVAVNTWQCHVAPTGEPREEPRAEVTGRIDGIVSVGPVGHADSATREANQERGEVGLWRLVEGIYEREDKEHQERRADDLVDQGAYVAAEVGGREGGEDAEGGGGACHAPYYVVGDRKSTRL